jgi:hypothetical protein
MAGRRQWAERTSPDDPWGCFDEVTGAEEHRDLAAAKGFRDGVAEITGDDTAAVATPS